MIAQQTLRTILPWMFLCASFATECAMASTGLEILPGEPDRIRLDGTLLSSEESDRSIRWQGMWMTRLPVHPGSSEGTAEGGAKHVIMGACLRLDVALPAGRFMVEVDLEGAGRRCGPLDIALNDSLAVSQVTAMEETQRTVSVVADNREPFLSLYFRADPEEWVLLSAVRIRPIPDCAIRLGLLGAGAQAPEGIPQGAPCTDEDLTDCLRLICERLVLFQLPSGLYDYEAFSWWEVSYAVRTLLAGYSIFGDKRFLAAAQRSMLSFVSQQNSDGGFCAYYLRKKDLTQLAKLGLSECETRNTADLGTATTCLSLMIPVASPEDRVLLLDAHTKYIESYASRFRMESGAYANGRFDRRDERFAYSVATATQAVSLVALHRVTHRQDHLAQAESAVRFLLHGWAEDGRPLFHQHDQAEPYLIEAMALGDVFYVLEALLCVYYATSDDSLRAAIRSAGKAYLLGEKGFLASVPPDGWIPMQSDLWAASKGNAMLGVLIGMRRVLADGGVGDPRIDRAIELGKAALCREGLREAYGVAERPCADRRSRTSIRSSFAGISIAEALRPGAMFGAMSGAKRSPTGDKPR